MSDLMTLTGMAPGECHQMIIRLNDPQASKEVTDCH